MYTIDCEDPNCVKCLQDSKDESSEEENQNKMTFEELVSNDLFSANEKRARCLAECREMKDEIQRQIGRLIAVFRERERELCIQVEKGFKTQMAIIDHDTTVQCMDKILKRKSEPLKTPRRLVFKFDLEPTWMDLKNFGQLTYEEVPKRVLQQRRDMFEGFSMRMDERLSKKKNLYFFVDDDGKFSRRAMEGMMGRIGEITQKLENLHVKENQKPKTNEPMKRSDDLKTSGCLPKRPKPIRAIVDFDNLNKSVENEGRYFDDGTTSTTGEVFRLDKLSDEKLEMHVKDLVEKRKRYEQARLAILGKEPGKDISSKERKRAMDDSLHFEGLASMPRVTVDLGSLSDDDTVKNAVKELNEESTFNKRKRCGPTHEERRRYEEARLAWYGKEAVRELVPIFHKRSKDEEQHCEKRQLSAFSAELKRSNFMDYETMKGLIEIYMDEKKRIGPKMEMHEYKGYEKIREALFGKEVGNDGVLVPDLNKSSEVKRQHFEKGTASVSSAKVEMDNFKEEMGKVMETLKMCRRDPTIEGRKRYEQAVNTMYGNEVVKDRSEDNTFLLLANLQDEQSKRYEEARLALYGKEAGKEGISVLDLNKSSKDEVRHFEEGTASVSSAEVGMDSLSDEDMEIISKNEAASIPSESPPLPPKDRLMCGRKRSWRPSLFFRKPRPSPENKSPSENPTPDPAGEFQESLGACISRHKRVSEESPSFNVDPLSMSPTKSRLATSSDDDSRKELRTSNAFERKEIPASQEFSSECLMDSSAEGQGHDPSAALLSSFQKYLEKNSEGEWLVREKSSEQSASAGNFEQWLSTNDE